MSDEEADDATTAAEREYPRTVLAEDARSLVATLEAIHPDPYAGHGGRIELHRRLEETVRALPERATAEAFYRRVAPLVAGVGDAHTTVELPDGEDAGDRRLPLSLRVVGTRLYVEAVHDESLADLPGARLTRVDGRDVDALADRQAELRGAENRYGALAFLGSSLESYENLDRLLDRADTPSELRLTVRTADGADETHVLAPVGADSDAVETLPTTVRRPDGDGPRYRLLGGGRTALFVPGDLQGYREHVEMLSSSGSEDLAEFARQAHDGTVDGPAPEDLDAVVAALPSMTETLTALVREMADAGTETLVVDLRDNPGGNSMYADLLTYVLYGWEGLGRFYEGYSVVRRTDAHRRRYGDGVFGESQVDTATENPADFDFGQYFQVVESDRDGRVETVRERLTSRSETFAREAAAGTHAGYYCPEQVVAVTSAGTFSSGLAAPLQVSKLGGDVVGVPSGQRPNCFGEPVTETLANTGLELDVAGKALFWRPDLDGDVLVPDHELTPEAFDRYDRAGDAALRLALDHATGRT